MTHPEVSVVMGVYNGAEDLEQTLDSVLSQRGCDLEFIVVNDGSTDDTGRILDQWAARDGRLRIIHQQNTGLTRALMKGCAEAKGQFIARQDVGDVSVPGRLAAQVDLLRCSTEVVAVSSFTSFFGPAGEFLYCARIEADVLNKSLMLANESLCGPSHHGSVMMRRAAYESAGGYRSAFYFAQDLDLWTRIVERGSFAVIPAVLYEARLKPASISGSHGIEQAHLAEIIIRATNLRRSGVGEEGQLAKAAEIRGILKGEKIGLGRAALGNYFIGSCLLDRDSIAAKGYFKKAVQLRPTFLRAWLKMLICQCKRASMPND